MSQLMSGEPRNQNIPGLDTILRGEIMRKDTLIAQLMNQNKMLMAQKERQDLEITSQGETLEVTHSSNFLLKFQYKISKDHNVASLICNCQF